MGSGHTSELMENAPSGPAKFLVPDTPPALFTLIVIAGASAMSMNLFLPSLPGMAAYFGTEYAFMQLSISAYLGVTGVMQIFLGPLSDRYGRRAILLWSFGIFCLATLGCLFAPNAEIFMFFRMLQAVIATGMALSRAIVRDMVSDEEAASMMGYLAMGMAVVPMIGPIVGGVLEEYYNWRAVFVFMFALGAAVFLLMLRDLGETNARQTGSFREQFEKYPGLMRSRRFWGYTFSGGFASGCFFAFIGGAPYVGTEFFNIPPTQLGIYFGFVAFGYMMGNFFTARFASRIGINMLILLGLLIALAAIGVSLVATYSGFSHPLGVFGCMIFVGFGNGLTMPNAQAGMLSVRPDLAGSASGLGGAVLIGGGAILSAATGMLLGPETGPFPLLWMMFGSAFFGVLIAIYVIRREAFVKRQELTS